MKKTLLLLFFVALLNAQLISQNIFINQDHRVSKITDIISLNDSTYVQALILDLYDHQGLLQWVENDIVVKNLKLENFINDIQLRMSKDSLIADISILIECDVAIPVFESINIDTVSNSSLWIGYENSLGGFKKAKFMGEDKFVVLKSEFFDGLVDSMKIYSSKYQVLERVELPASGIENLSIYDNSIFAFGGENVIVYNDDLSEWNTINLPGEMVKDVVAGDSTRFYILTNSGVYSQASTFDFSSLIPFDEAGFEAKDLVHIDQPSFAPILYVIGENSSGQNTFLSYSDTGWFSDIESFSDYSEMNRLHEINDDQLFVTGNLKFEKEDIGEYKGSSIVQKLSFVDHLTDDLSINFIERNSINNNSLEITVEVFNNSANDLADVNVYSTPLFGVWCTSFYFDKVILMLAAESSIIVKDTIEIYDGVTISTDLCLYAAGSGRVFDTNFVNNFSCSLISGSDDVIYNQRLEIFPNPTSDYLYIDAAEMNETYAIYNINGVLMYKIRYGTGLHTSILSPGIYFVKNEEHKIMKFVKI